jgi:two-component system chemotaxis sensor kinase CheA
MAGGEAVLTDLAEFLGSLAGRILRMEAEPAERARLGELRRALQELGRRVGEPEGTLPVELAAGLQELEQALAWLSLGPEGGTAGRRPVEVSSTRVEALLEAVERLQARIEALRAGEAPPSAAAPALSIEAEPFVSAAGIEPGFLREFMLSSLEILEATEQAVMRHEREGNPDHLHAVMRGFHTLKGDSSYLGLKRLASFCHDLETVVKHVQEKLAAAGPPATDTGREPPAGRPTVDLLLAALDEIRSALRSLEPQATGGDAAGTAAEPASWAFVRRILVQAGEPEERPAAGTDVAVETAAAGENAGGGAETQRAFREQVRQYLLALRPTDPAGLPADPPARAAVKRALLGLRKAGRFIGFTYLAELAAHVEQALEQGDAGRYAEAVHRILSVMPGLGIGPGTPGVGGTGAGKAAVGAGGTRSVRVDEEKIELLSDEVGELFLAGNTHQFLVERLSRLEAVPRDLVETLRLNAEHLARSVSALRRRVMSLRMVPLGSVLGRFRRMVRDLALEQGKEIDLAVSGAAVEVEVERKVAEVLAEPLMHLVRNACGHGVEPPEERRRKGKPPRGTISIAAEQAGGVLELRVGDDGRGLDLPKIRRRAAELGIPVRDPQDEASYYDLIFLPGVTTSERVTGLAGRGVGLDAVRTAVQAAGGRVAVRSAPGAGAEVILTIPMSMGVVDALLFESGGQLFAFPLASVEEVVKRPGTLLFRSGGRLGMHHRGRAVPVVPFAELLAPEGGEEGARRPALSQEHAIAVLAPAAGPGAGAVAVLVDRFVRNLELAVKPVPEKLQGMPGLSGVSILGGGELVLLLDPGELFAALPDPPAPGPAGTRKTLREKEQI